MHGVQLCSFAQDTVNFSSKTDVKLQKQEEDIITMIEEKSYTVIIILFKYLISLFIRLGYTRR